MSVKLDRKQKTILQRAINDDAFSLMQDIATALLTQWAQGTMMDDTAFKTAANAIKREERKQAIKIYLEELQRLAFQDNEQ